MAVIVTKAQDHSTNKCRWVNCDGIPMPLISGKMLSDSIYEHLHWIKQYQFRFRGITKERNGIKFIIFSLDEPQILVGKTKLTVPESNIHGSIRFIPYRDNGEIAAASGDGTAYPVEWDEKRGVSYAMHCRRDAAINAISGKDLYGFRIALIVISRTIFASIRFAIPIAPRVQCPVKPAPTYRAHCISAHFNSSCKIFRACIHFTLILPLFVFLTAAHKYYGFSGTVMLSEAPSLGSASALRYTHLIVYVFPTLFPMLST